MRIAGPFLVALFALTGTAAAAPGDPWIAYVANSTASRAVVMRVNPVTGELADVSRNGAQGSLFQHPYDLAVASDGSLLVADMGAYAVGAQPPADGAIVRVDPATGTQSVVSQGGRLVDPAGLALAADGTILVVENVGVEGEPELLRVEPASGAQTVVSSGDKLCYPFGVAVEASGTIVVTDFGTPPGELGTCAASLGQVLRVDPASGGQAILTCLSCGRGSLLRNPFGVTVEPDGGILVVNQSGNAAALMRVHPVSGQQSVVSPNATTTDAFEVPQRVSLPPDGEAIVTDFELNDYEGGLVRVQMPGGAQTILRQGGHFNNPLGVAVVVNRPPAAAISASPGAIRGGGQVSYDASGSTDPEAQPLRYHWDLDGNGSFETSSGSAATATGTYTGSTTFTARVQVTDPHGASSTAGAPVVVDSIAPMISALQASRRRLGRDTTFSYRLSEAAQVTIALQRRRRGRWSTVLELRELGAAGSNRLRFKRRSKRRRLAPGAYRALALAADAVGNRSKPKRVALRVLAAKRP